MADIDDIVMKGKNLSDKYGKVETAGNLYKMTQEKCIHEWSEYAGDAVLSGIGKPLSNATLGVHNWANRAERYSAEAEGRSYEPAINPGCEEFFKQQKHVRQSPISLDLDGNGIEVLSYQNGSQAVFDFNADGIMNHTSWIGKTDGMLALDRDGDGQITSGQELFGDSTVLADGTKAANGYEALAELDANKDGKIDSQDEAFEKLQVWVDADGDGKLSVNKYN